MTVVDQIDKKICLVIEGERSKMCQALYLNEMIENQQMEIVSPDEQVDSNGIIMKFMKFQDKSIN